MWTFQRFVFPLIALIITILGQPIIGGMVIGFGGLTDFFDGRSARKHASSSEFGNTLDQVADKFFILFAGINVSIINPIFIPIILMEASIASVNIYYKKKYPTINDKSSFIGRAKQFPLFTAVAFGFLSNINIYLKTITDILVLLTIIAQSVTLLNYSKTKYIEAKKIDNEKHLFKNNLITETENKNQKTKTLTYKKNVNIGKNKVKQKIKKKDRY